MRTTLFHIFLLMLTIALGFGAEAFYRYELIFVLALSAVYWIVKRVFLPDPLKHRLADAGVLTLLTVSLVNTTGGAGSPVFFLIYGLMFGLSLLLEPPVGLAAGLTLIVFYLLDLPANQTVKDLLPIVSIAFITPFALLLGEEYQKLLQEKKDILILKKKNQALRRAIDNLLAQHES